MRGSCYGPFETLIGSKLTNYVLDFEKKKTLMGYSELLRFWTFAHLCGILITREPNFSENLSFSFFGGEGMETPTQLGPLEKKANLN
jgi:hypothetical protein